MYWVKQMLFAPECFLIGSYAQLGHNNLINTGSIIEHEAMLEAILHMAP